MAIRTISEDIETGRDLDKHPKGLYVLFATEMWERFSFYTMVSMFTLYLRDPNDGFAWTAAQASTLYANYMMFVYCSPLIGGWIADKKLGYRRAVMFGGFFFMAGHLLLSVRSMAFVYAALTCLVIGNGFFKPNVSTMVGNLYPDGSHLKDRAYNLFYMGINVGAFLAPLVATMMQKNFGFHPAFAVAAFGMVISVTILWRFKHYLGGRQVSRSKTKRRFTVKSRRQTQRDGSRRRVEAHRRADSRVRRRSGVLDGVSSKRHDDNLLGG